jgi:uncharacterized protein YndB with AHSA1/START domain
MCAGTVRIGMAKVPRVRQSYYLAVPRERVFSALTKPKELARWFVATAVVTPRKGGSYRLTWIGGFTMRGRIHAIDPPNSLEVDWIDRPAPGKVFETRARFELKRAGRGTTLTVTHRGFKSGKAWISLYGNIQSGWAMYLMNLRSVLEHRTDLRSRRDRLG